MQQQEQKQYLDRSKSTFQKTNNKQTMHNTPKTHQQQQQQLLLLLLLLLLQLQHFWLVVSSENAQTTMEEPELGLQFG
jgi:hypothetical protein